MKDVMPKVSIRRICRVLEVLDRPSQASGSPRLGRHQQAGSIPSWWSIRGLMRRAPHGYRRLGAPSFRDGLLA